VQELGSKVADDEWAIIQQLGALTAAADGDEESFRHLLQVVKDNRKLRRGRSKRDRTQRGVVRPDERSKALARIAASFAGRYRDVQRWRSASLGSQLLEPSEVASWIEEQAKRQGQPTRYEIVPIDAEGRLNPRMVGRRRIGETFFEEISYRSADGEPRRVPIREGCPLFGLKHVSALVARQFHWVEEDAVVFVLSGAAPPPRYGRWQAIETQEVGVGVSPGLGMIHLEVAPHMSAKRVSKLYKEARKKAFDGRQPRAIGKLQADLAVFAGERNDGSRTLADLHREWNRGRRNGRYPDVRVFRRAVKEAYERVTGTPLRWR